MTQVELNQWYNTHIAPYVAPDAPNPGAIAAQIYALTEGSVTGGVVKDFNDAVRGPDVRNDIVYLAMLQRAYNDLVTAKANKITTTVAAQVEETAEKLIMVNGSVGNQAQNNYADVLLFGDHVEVSDWSRANKNFHWVSASTCHVESQDASSGATAINYYNDTEKLPPYMIPGKTYRVEYSSVPSSMTTQQVRLNITAYKNGSVMTDQDIYYTGNGSFTLPTDAEGIRIRLYVNGNVAVDETVTARLLIGVDAAKVESGLGAHQNETKTQGGHEFTAYMLHNDDTHHGVTFAWDGEYCTISGTADGNAVNVMFTNHTAFRAGIEPGKTYHVTADGFVSGVKFNIRCFKPSSVVGADDIVLNDMYYDAAGVYTVPDDATGMLIRLFVADGTDLTGTQPTVRVGISDVPTNKMLDNRVNGIADDLVIGRNYTSDDVETGIFWNLGREDRAFNAADRGNTDANYGKLLIPITKGDTVKLKTKGGTGNAKPFGIIKYNQLIDKIFPTDYDGVSAQTVLYNDVFVAEYDGWLAVNILLSYAGNFRCEVISPKPTVYDGAVLSEANKNDGYRGFVTYDDNNVCKSLNNGMSMAAMLHHWAIVGASFDSGEFNYSSGGTAYELEWYAYSCWELFKKMNGIPDLRNYSDGGQNARDWILLKEDSNITGHPSYLPTVVPTARGYYYATDTLIKVPSTTRRGIGIGGGCWWKMLEDYRAGAVNQVFVINLGSNDINNNYPHDGSVYDPTPVSYNKKLYYTCGTTADIGTFTIDLDDPDDYGTDTLPSGKTASDTAGFDGLNVVNSYAGYIGAILNRILAIQPDAVIFLCTIRNGFANTAVRYGIWNEYNTVLKSIAAMDAYKNNVYIIDNGEFGPNYAAEPMTNMMVGVHPNAIGYKHLADVWNTLIDHSIKTNYEKLKRTQFIGYDDSDVN